MNNSQCIRVRWRLRRLHRRRSSDHHPPSKTFISAFIWSDHATLNTAAPSLSGMPSLDCSGPECFDLKTRALDSLQRTGNVNKGSFGDRKKI
ncbi:uncharacterized protein LOC110029199 isoform X3 [Phalaenopsis equestris]|uniref:uncharacterized protein LOC110029199 isoform X3 n=1 Tax=Phalaenopsis equestris TaxID=78828 RepID=UPI0009E6150C|nr:uncharacterized protein LOC110029199 isoform X3 [Phalaenopsis equestris]